MHTPRSPEFKRREDQPAVTNSDAPTLIEALKRCLSNNVQERKPAEQYIAQCEIRPSYLSFLYVCCDWVSQFSVHHI